MFTPAGLLSLDELAEATVALSHRQEEVRNELGRRLLAAKGKGMADEVRADAG